MTAKTKYSRSTWKKKQLQASMNTPSMGNNACSLCADRSIPQNLNEHVSDYQTCADVHLQLALLRYDNAMCAVGQQQYQEICCPVKGSGPAVKTTLGFLAGVFVVGYLIKKLSVKQTSGRANRPDDKGSSKNSGLPMTHQSSSSSSGCGNSTNSNRSKTSSELELPTTDYQNMDNLPMTMKRSTTGQSRSQSRPRPQSKGRPQSRSRSRGRLDNRAASRSRTRSQSRSRALKETLSRSDSLKRSSSRVTSDCRPRSGPIPKTSQNQSRNRSKSRDRQQRPQPHHPSFRQVTYNHHHYQSTGHVIEYNINPYDRQEEVEVSSDAGPILPTQLV